MTRVYLRLILLPVIVFAVIVLLIQMQPRDDRAARQLHDLLSPDGCTAPCVMGIRPGRTTSNEAMPLLKNHPWVAQVVPINTENPYQIWWVWNQDAPDFLRNTPTNPNFPVNGEVLSDGKTVSGVYFDSGLTLNDIALVWGIPRDSQLIFGGIVMPPDPSRHAITAFPYEKQGFWASGDAPCPYNAHVWDSPAHLQITDEFHGISLGTVIPVKRLNFMQTVRQTSLQVCGF